jgi:hypothetical protein
LCGISRTPSRAGAQPSEDQGHRLEVIERYLGLEALGYERPRQNFGRALLVGSPNLTVLAQRSTIPPGSAPGSIVVADIPFQDARLRWTAPSAASLPAIGPRYFHQQLGFDLQVARRLPIQVFGHRQPG